MKLPEMEAEEQQLLQKNDALSSAKGFYEELGVSIRLIHAFMPVHNDWLIFTIAISS